MAREPCDLWGWEVGAGEEPPHTCKGLHTERQRLGPASGCRETQGKCRAARGRGKSRRCYYLSREGCTQAEAASIGYVRSRWGPRIKTLRAS